MSNTSHAGPAEKDLMQLGLSNPMGSGSKPKSADHALVKSKGGGLGGAGKKTLDDRARSAHEQAAKEDAPTPEMVKANTPGPETAAVKPKATLKKIGWIAEKTYFKSDAEVYAEFDIPPAIADKTLVEFELFRKENGEFKAIKKAQTHVDASGRGKALLPVPASEEPKATFAIKVKHCSADWSSGQGTEREVTETAEISIEHTQVSGIHFQKGKSFIADIYLNALCEVKKTYLEWKKTHAKAQIVVYGHTEQDEQEDPLNISRNRALSAFLFVIGDVDLWANIAEKERWGVWEQQCMLRALGFFKTKPTGNLGTITRKAIQDFIAFLNEARCKNINPMLGLSEAYIRKELYREYMNLKRSEIELPSSAFRQVSGYPYVGCCAFNRYQAGEVLHQGNRRVVFLMLQESPNFPAVFPCRSSSTGPCETESKKPGDRAIKGFMCKFYDEMVKQEKVGEASSSGNGHEIETHWKGYPAQNDFNDDIYAAAKKYSIEPLILKSLIAQESGFRPKIHNNVGYAGLTQIGGAAIDEAGLSKGTTAKIDGKYVYDMEGDERFDSQKSIFGGAHILSIKRDRINKSIFSKYKTQPSDAEKQKFYIAAYNAGEGTVKKAWKKNGEDECVWEDLIEDPEQSALWSAIPEAWGRKSKYKEITDYVSDILKRKES
ncbi:MAG: transglycosylase SLT domain-containing protein [Fibrobacteria bacterium]